ncbi:amidohydrolase family protein [Streptomyces sp. uw30]|uniref:amidohydrolase family protein n=1 Tax=Streptomyces sp. uw30 TaxID=1828179 RepID=UPI00165111C2|nr:amidohydrolase family protein [Streptomyces sp. uw30]
MTLDPGIGDLPQGDVLIRDGIITAVGPALAPQVPGTRVVDARGRLVIPGLVDTHRHLWQGALGGHTGQVSLTGYSGAVIADLAPRYTPEDLYAGTLWGALQALNAGITTVADWAHNLSTPEHADANVRALHDSGIRAVFLYGGPGPDGLGFFGAPAPRHPADARRLQAEHFPRGINGRLRMGLALRGPSFTTPEATRDDFAFARDLGLPISVHVGMAGFPGAVVALDKLGLLGPDVNHAHAAQLSDREFGLIADSGGSISLSPSVDMLMALGTYPATGHALARGIPAGLSVDTTTGSGTDLFTEMRLALAAERSRANASAVSRNEAVESVELNQRDMLRLATLDAARVWHLEDEVGSLTPGKRADVAVVDMRPPHLDGFGDPVTTLVMGAGTADIEMVVVGGQVVKADGMLTGAIAGRARELMHESRANLRDRTGRKAS